MKKIAIHQPNFFPWLGYFNKIHSSDIFIHLDDVQFEKKNAGNWTNRTNVQLNGEKKWVTAAINRKFSGSKMINQIKFSEEINWKKNFINKLNNYYKNSLFFEETILEIIKIFEIRTLKLSEFNINATNHFSKILNLNQPIFYNSSTFNLKSKKSERLIDLVLNLNGTIFIAGLGSSGYLNEQLFFQNSIKIEYQKYDLVKYKQNHNKNFVPRLSIIDTLMNCGFEKTEKLIKNEKEL